MNIIVACEESQAVTIELQKLGHEAYSCERAIIWCEVACSNCGGVIGFDYRNAKTISVLKKKVKDWKYCREEGNLCPDCYKAWKKKKSEGIDK